MHRELVVEVFSVPKERDVHAIRHKFGLGPQRSRKFMSVIIDCCGLSGGFGDDGI